MNKCIQYVRDIYLLHTCTAYCYYFIETCSALASRMLYSRTRTNIELNKSLIAAAAAAVAAATIHLQWLKNCATQQHQRRPEQQKDPTLASYMTKVKARNIK